MVKKSYFDGVKIPLENGEYLYGTFLQPKAETRRIVFAPPLIGSTAELQLQTFKHLATRDSKVFSFEYRGHHRSTGVFSLEHSVQDTKAALMYASECAASEGLPLHVVSTCYGTMTLLPSFNSQTNPPNVSSISSISGLFSLDYVIKPEDITKFVFQGLGIEATPDLLAPMVENGRIDFADRKILRVFSNYLRKLFPKLDIGENHFGKLDYERTDRKSTILAFLDGRFLDGVTIPTNIPMSVFCGTDDKVIDFSNPKTKEKYCGDVHRVAPHARIEDLDIDHFGRGIGRTYLLEELCKIFEKKEMVFSAN